MAEYISRSELQSEITKGVGECRINAFDPSVNCILQIIHRLAAEDVQPVKHTKNLSTFDFCDEFICENCGIHLAEWVKLDVEDYEEFEFKFCPNCGARMIKDGETNG